MFLPARWEWSQEEGGVEPVSDVWVRLGDRWQTWTQSYPGSPLYHPLDAEELGLTGTVVQDGVVGSNAPVVSQTRSLFDN